MEISLILMQKTVSLFLILLMGVVLVRSGLVKSAESRTISMVTLYLILPCAVINAFQKDSTPEARSALLLALVASVVMEVAYIPLVKLLAIPFHLDPLEQVAVIYSNSGNLAIPLITAILGPDYILYPSVYMSVQTLLMWSHAKSTLCGEKKIDWKKILTNINMIAVLVGAVFFLIGFRLPGPVADAVSSTAAMVGPISMLVTGMLFGGIEWKQLLKYKRLPLICMLRLIILPVLSILFLRLSGLSRMVPDGDRVLLAVSISAITPMAATITQMAQIYDRDADYASAINVVTTMLCIVTMPIMVLLYQMIG